MTPESRTSYAEESPQPRTHTSIFGVTTVKFEHGPLQFTFSSHEPPLVQFEANPRGGRSLELQYRRVRLKFELSTPPDGSSYEEHYRPEGYPYREDGHFYREGEEEEETKITCTALQEEGYDLPAEIAVDFRMPFNFSISSELHVKAICTLGVDASQSLSTALGDYIILKHTLHKVQT